MNRFVLIFTSVALAPSASALDFSFDNGITLDLDTTMTYGAQWRVESRKSSISADAFLDALAENPFLPLTDERLTRQQTVILNGDDGNNNFDTGLISNSSYFAVGNGRALAGLWPVCQGAGILR